jgi:mannitol/fructose-specific phosphotransferase system IIA component (Ntr-type)
LAAVARKLRDPKVLADLRLATTATELYKAVAA